MAEEEKETKETEETEEKETEETETEETKPEETEVVEEPEETEESSTGELLTEIKGMLMTLQTSLDLMNQGSTEETAETVEEEPLDLEEDLIQLED